MNAAMARSARAAAENDVASDRGRRHSHPESRAADDSPLPRDRAQLLAHTTNELRASGREFAGTTRRRRRASATLKRY